MNLKSLSAALPALLCAFVLFSVPAYGAETQMCLSGSVAPAYEIATNPASNLEISGKTATCESSAAGSNCASITVVQTLQKYGGFLWVWNDVSDATWSKTIKSNSVMLSKTKSGLSSGTYRLKSVFTLTSTSGETETITVYSSEATVD